MRGGLKNLLKRKKWSRERETPRGTPAVVNSNSPQKTNEEASKEKESPSTVGPNEGEGSRTNSGKTVKGKGGVVRSPR